MGNLTYFRNGRKTKKLIIPPANEVWGGGMLLNHSSSWSPMFVGKQFFVGSWGRYFVGKLLYVTREDNTYLIYLQTSESYLSYILCLFW